MGSHYMEISLDDRANADLTAVARDHGISKTAALQLGLGLLAIARKYKGRGRLAVVSPDGKKLVSRIRRVYED